MPPGFTRYDPQARHDEARGARRGAFDLRAHRARLDAEDEARRALPALASA